MEIPVRPQLPERLPEALRYEVRSFGTGCKSLGAPMLNP